MSDDSNIFKKSTSTYYDCYFIRSDYISIYPSAYRDSKYDIKAKINLEDNIIASAKQLKRNYILRWDNPTPAANTTISTLYCILGGYFFILKISLNDLPASYTFLTIKLNTSLPVKENVYTTVLDSLTGEGRHTQLDSGGTTSYFYGVVFANEDLTSTSQNIYSLNLASQASYFGLAAADILGDLQNIHDSRSIATNLVNGIANTNPNNNLNNTSITGLYYDGNSVLTANELSETQYSFVYGDGNKLKGDSGRGAADHNFIFGKNNEVTGYRSYNMLFGLGLKNEGNSHDLSLIIGQYNEVTTDRFIIGSGSGNDNRKNIFTVSPEGNTTAKGTLTIGADATENVVLDVKNGSINVEGGADLGGALKIKGENGLTIANTIGDTVTITNSGMAYFATSLDIGGEDNPDLGRALFVNGKTGITGTLEVNDKSNLQGEVSIDNTKLNLHKNTSNTYDTIFEYNTTNKCLEIKVM